MMKNTLKQLKIASIPVTIASEEEVLNFIVFKLKEMSKIFITTPNPEIVVAASKDKKLNEALNKANIALPDGVGLVWANRLLNGVNIKRIRGREFFIKLLEVADEKHLKVFLLGASQSVNNEALAIVKEKYLNIKADGSNGPLLDKEIVFYTERDRKMNIDIIKSINKFKPDFLFVAFGVPKQEKWIYKNLDNLNVKVAMTVGGTFDYFTKKVSIPPDWVARLGLEWLWRLKSEPTRLPRILNATVVFPIMVLKAKINQIISR